MKLLASVSTMIILVGLLSGCGSSEPAAADQDTAKANFTKSMTKEEAEAAGVGGAAPSVEGKGGK